MLRRWELRYPLALAVCFAFGTLESSEKSIQAQTVQAQTVPSAGVVLAEALTSFLNRIPAAMRTDCQGVAIVPNVIEVGSWWARVMGRESDSSVILSLTSKPVDTPR